MSPIQNLFPPKEHRVSESLLDSVADIGKPIADVTYEMTEQE